MSIKENHFRVDAVLKALQELDEIDGLEGKDYIDTMLWLGGLCLIRARTCLEHAEVLSE